MSEKQFRITTNPKSNAVAFDEKQKKHYIGIDLEDLLNEQQAMINELKIDEVVNLLNRLSDENKELKLQLEAFKDKLCELGVSDVKLYGKRYYTGLEEWLE